MFAENVVDNNPQAVGLLSYFKSCGASPMMQPAKKWLCAPMVVTRKIDIGSNEAFRPDLDSFIMIA